MPTRRGSVAIALVALVTAAAGVVAGPTVVLVAVEVDALAPADRQPLIDASALSTVAGLGVTARLVAAAAMQHVVLSVDALVAAQRLSLVDARTLACVAGLGLTAGLLLGGLLTVMLKGREG